MTRQEIRTLARKKLGETTASFWTDTEMNNYINYACSNIAERTLCLRDNSYISTTAVVENTGGKIESEFTLTANFPLLIGIYEVQFQTNGNTWRKMQMKFRDDLDIEQEGWRDAVGRTISNPASVPSFTVTNITQASPAVVTTSVPHGFADNQAVALTGVLGMTEINGTTYYVKSSPTPTTLELEEQPTGPDLNSTGFTAYISGGTIGDAAPFIYNFEATPATPDTYWWDYEEDKLGLYPPCDVDNATSDNLRVYFHCNHAVISDDADSPRLPSQLHLGVVDWVVATGFETRGLADKANDSWNKFFKRLEEYHTNKLKAREDDDIQMKPHRSVSGSNH